MQNRRHVSSYWINPSYQGKFLLIFGSFLFLQTAVFFYALMQVFSELDVLVRIGETDPQVLAAQFQHLESSTYLIFGGLFILLLVVFVAFAFRFTHKTAGAVFRIETTFNQMAKEGSLKELKLRDGDFFIEIETAFNTMIKKIK